MAETYKFSNGFESTPTDVTKLQRQFLVQNAEAVMEILTPEERTAAELMGFDDWLKVLDRWEASRLIERIKNESVARDVRRQSGGGPDEPDRKSRRWFETGYGE